MILVTGGAGYIGSHVALALIEQGFDVVIVDNLENGHPETVEILKNIKSKGKIVAFERADVKNPNDISQVFTKYKIAAVMHFAAYICVEESVKNPQKYYYNNLIGSLNLITSMVENHIHKIVFSSTAAVYGDPSYEFIDEKHDKNPINPYGNSKAMVEKILDDYDAAYDIKSVRLRYFNVAGADSKIRIGELHNPETHLIPRILASSSDSDEEFQLYGNDYNTKDGTCVRDYVNVEDLAEAHILALKYLIRGGNTDYFNIGTSDGNTVKEVFSICENITGRRISIKINERRSGDPERLVADNKKALNILGWKPKRTLEDSIKTAYKWHMKNTNK